MSIENMKTVTTPLDLEENHVFEIIGPSGSGKTTFARRIGEFYSNMGNKVLFFQTKYEAMAGESPKLREYSTFLEINGILYHHAVHENHVAHLCQHGVIEPNLIIFDELYQRYPEERTPEGIEKIYSRLEEFAKKYNCKILVTRQCGIPRVDKIEFRAHVSKMLRTATPVKIGSERL